MRDPAAIVREFLVAASQGRQGFDDAVRVWFTPSTIWENVGVATTIGPDEALAFMDRMEPGTGIASIHIETLAMATVGNRVLTERIDHMVAADGRTLMSLRLMGVFELDADGKIVRWSDYFDTAGFNAQLGSFQLSLE